jgi:glycosyltransferase involved in cell wall biosynthesis
MHNVPVDTLYVIDNYSTDSTAEIARKYGANIIFYDGSLAEARLHSFEVAKTPYFVSVDSDVELCKGWYSKVKSLMTYDAGVVWGLSLDQHPLQKAYATSMWKLKPSSVDSMTHLPNALFRKSAVSKLPVPKLLKSGAVANEDFYIANQIKMRGFHCVTARIISKHYCDPPLIDHKTYWYGASARVSKAHGFKSILFRFALGLPQGIISALISRNCKVLPYWVKFRFQVLYGWLHWSRYVHFKRDKP